MRKSGEQLDVPGTPPAVDVLVNDVRTAMMEAEVNDAVLEVTEAEKALRAARVRERQARAALARQGR